MKFKPQIPPFAIPFLGMVFMLLVSHLPLQAQWMQPNRFHFGGSLGFGGMHEWGKPSIDLHKERWTLRVSPGLYYASTGITYKAAYYRPKRRTDRAIIMSVYYLNDWFLSNLRNKEVKKDVQAFMFMPGMHVDLNHLGQYYLEVSAGYTYGFERNFDANKTVLKKRHHHLPMVEIRIGGVFLSRKERHQTFKYYPRTVKKIQQKKLKFKD